MLLRFTVILLILFSALYILVGLDLTLFSPYLNEIPSQPDWVDHGPIFMAGELGDWDYQLYGGFTVSVIKKDGAFYLYYQGASGYRTSPDETVTWRAIGVATSQDGINFRKAENNPVITWFPNQNGEEGAVSAGTTLDADGNIVIFYGANTEKSSSLVNADARAAISKDGLSFKDLGVAIKHDDPAIWGSRDEIFPILAIHHKDQWFVYYLPNGIVESGWLGVAWGNDFDRLSNSARARMGIFPVKGWGTGSYAEISNDKYALFINNIREGTIRTYLMSLKNPARLSLPVQTYRFEGVQQASFYLDQETRTWFMFYRGNDYYGVMTAPAREKDQTPPSAPQGVTVKPYSDTEIDLTWKPAVDIETGIATYKIFRDGKFISTAKGWSYLDTGLTELMEYRYQVQAVNYHNIEGPLSETFLAKSLADTDPPYVTSVSGSTRQVKVLFNEILDEQTANDTVNYVINKGIRIIDAKLQPDRKTVLLETTNHTENEIYQLSQRGILDQANLQNPSPGEVIAYTVTSILGLMGAWNFDEGAGEEAKDTATYLNNGKLIYIDQPGPTWVEGKVGTGLQFDGLDDQVTIQKNSHLADVFLGSHSISLWVKPGKTPRNSTPNDEYYTIFKTETSALTFDAENRFTGSIWLENGESMHISSKPAKPGEWHHLVLTINTIEKLIHLYVDGKEVQKSPLNYTGVMREEFSMPLYIGTSDPLKGRYENRMYGIVDQVKVFASELSSEQVIVLYTNDQ